MTNTVLTVLDGLALVVMVAVSGRAFLDLARLWPLRRASSGSLVVGVIVLGVVVSVTNFAAG